MKSRQADGTAVSPPACSRRNCRTRRSGSGTWVTHLQCAGDAPAVTLAACFLRQLAPTTAPPGSAGRRLRPRRSPAGTLGTPHIVSRGAGRNGAHPGHRGLYRAARGRPAIAYREYLYRPDGQLATWIDGRFNVVARAVHIGQRLQEGDVLLEVTFGPISPGRCAILAVTGPLTPTRRASIRRSGR